jgi:hypothetical protein
VISKIPTRLNVPSKSTAILLSLSSIPLLYPFPSPHYNKHNTDKMVKSAVLGYPRIGTGRAMKKVSSAGWGQEGERSLLMACSLLRLTGLARPLRRSSRRPPKPSGRSDGRLSVTPVSMSSLRKPPYPRDDEHGIELTQLSGDFTLYDHLLDHSFNFGVVPQRYVEQKLSPLDTFFGELRVSFWPMTQADI